LATRRPSALYLHKRDDIDQYTQVMDRLSAQARPRAHPTAGGHADTAGNPAAVPLAWRPLVERREPVQFALAGINAHINHDLPVAMVSTCAALATPPDASEHFADYLKVDQLLDAAEQSIRQSSETAAELAVDHHLSAVATLTCNWTINSARDLAWDNARLLWPVRDDPLARGLFLDSLAASTALASRMLLVAV
jgi:hypothetical protein